MAGRFGLASAALAVAGCGATIPEPQHRRIVAEQRAGYEARLFEAERARLACVADAERAREDAQASLASLQLRVQRLERARSPRSGLAPPTGARPLAQAWSPPSDRRPRCARRRRVALGGRSRSPRGSTWGPPGCGPRPAIRWIASRGFLSERATATVAVGVGRPEPATEVSWQEASERARVLVSALQRSGVAPSRLTLAVGGPYLADRVVFDIEERAAGARR